MKKFAIVAFPRTGSTALSNWFRDLDIHLGYEPFRPDKWNHQTVMIKPVLFEYYNRLKVHGIKHITSHIPHLANLELLDTLNSMNVKTIFLSRYNMVMSTISLFLAKQSDTWEIQHRDIPIDFSYTNFKPSAIPVEEIEAHIEWQSKNLDDYNLPKRQNLFRIEYEDIFMSSERTMLHNIDLLLDFIDIPKSGICFDLAKTHFNPKKKQNTPAIYKSIPNWEEIREHFNLVNI